MKKKEKISPPQKKNTSLRLEKKTLKSLKIAAIELDTSVQNIVEHLVLDFLTGDKSTIKRKL